MVMILYRAYILEGNIDHNVSFSEIWSLMQDSELNNSNKVMQRRLINCIRALEFLQLEPDLILENLKRVHKMVMQKEKHRNGKDVLIGECGKTQVFAGFKMFPLASAIEMLTNDVLNRYCSSSNDDPISTALKLFADVINNHPFEDGNERLCQVMLSHILMQRGCSLFPVLLSSFHKRGKEHYI